MVDYTDRLTVPVGDVRRISWGAIIAGTILALVIQIMLALLGLGIGLATLDPAGSDNPTLETFTSASGIWAALTVLIATFVGAYAAARFAGSTLRRDGALHGITTWATSTLVIVYLLTSGASALATSAFGALGTTVQSLGQAAQAVGSSVSIDQLPPELRRRAEELLARGQNAADQATDQAAGAADTARQATGNPDLGAAVSQIFQGLGQDATPEQRQAAIQAIAQQAGISPAEAEQRLNQLQGDYDQAVNNARQAAAKAAKGLSTTAFVAFVGLLLGLIVSAVGGSVGTRRAATTYYES